MRSHWVVVSTNRLAIFLALVFGLWLFPAQGQSRAAGQNDAPAAQEQNPKLTRADKSFLRAAAEENQAAVELGQMAERRGFSVSAKNFARTLVAQRSHAQQELATVARRLHLSLPLKLSRHDRKTVQKMEKNSGPRLDRIFLIHMAADLDRQYGTYEDTAMRTKNPEVKHYIESLLFQVKHQDQLANAIAPPTPTSDSAQ